MGKIYKQLNQKERDRIENLLRDGLSHRRIGEIVGRDRKTIDREIKRNTVKGNYVSNKAEIKKYQRRHNCKKQSKKIRENRELEEYIVEKMRDDKRSPEIISHVWNQSHTGKESIHFQRIYEYLYGPFGQQYCQYLQSKRYHPKKRKKNSSKKQLIPNRKWIEERESIHNIKKEYGHMEGDFMVSCSGDTTVLQTSIEKQSRYIQVRKQKNRNNRLTNTTLKKLIQSYPNIQTYTTDNDIAFQRYEEVQKDLQIPIYFCHPFHSWEKGQIENGNKQIRKWIPKKTKLQDISQKQIDKIVEKINNTPRKCLGWKTPQQVFDHLTRLKIQQKTQQKK